MFRDHRDEIKIQGPGSGIDAQSRVGGSTQDGNRHRHVGEFFVSVSVDIGRIQSDLLQAVVEQDACAAFIGFNG